MNDRYKKDFLHAGALAGQVRAYGKSLIVPGASYNDVLAKVHAKILALDAVPAFPPQIALNEVAAHFLPRPQEDIRFEDQLVKLDVGVCYRGAIGDCAVSIDLSGRYQGLVDAAEAALSEAQKAVQVGQPIRNIGKAIEDTIVARGFSPVRNLSGHGLGYYRIHTPPSIPNYDDRSSGSVKAGMTFAIEPFATNGKGLIEEQGAPAIFCLEKARSASTPVARMLLSAMRTFNGLPFGVRDFLDKGFGVDEVESTLHHMVEQGIIAGYPPLVEVAQGMVAQAENSVLVDRDGQVFITTLV